MNPLTKPEASLLRIPARAWAAALEVERASTRASAERLRAAFPDAAPARLVEIANARFIRRASGESATVGAVAAWPGMGTALSAGASGVQFLAFIAEAAHHCLTVAHLYGLDLKDPAKRTGLVLAALTGSSGAQEISMRTGVQALAWFSSSFLDVRTISAQKVNEILLKRFKRTAQSKFAASTIGRLAPFGIGAFIGWKVGASLARSTVDGLMLALGPAPASFAPERVVDVLPLGDPEDSRIFEVYALGAAAADEPDSSGRG